MDFLPLIEWLNNIPPILLSQEAFFKRRNTDGTTTGAPSQSNRRILPKSESPEDFRLSSEGLREKSPLQSPVLEEEMEHSVHVKTVQHQESLQTSEAPDSPRTQMTFRSVKSRGTSWAAQPRGSSKTSGVSKIPKSLKTDKKSVKTLKASKSSKTLKASKSSKNQKIPKEPRISTASRIVNNLSTPTLQTSKLSNVNTKSSRRNEEEVEDLIRTVAAEDGLADHGVFTALSAPSNYQEHNIALPVVDDYVQNFIRDDETMLATQEYLSHLSKTSDASYDPTIFDDAKAWYDEMDEAMGMIFQELGSFMESDADHLSLESGTKRP